MTLSGPRKGLLQIHRQAAVSRTQLLWAVLAAVTVLAAFLLYVPTLSLQGLWFDEGLSVAFASRSLADLLQTLAREDIHPPLYYLVLHFWIRAAGDSEWAVRFVSAFSAVLTVSLAYSVAREVWGHQGSGAPQGALVGLASGSLVATSPFLAYYAQETRMYALAAMLALAALAAYLRAIRGSARVRLLPWMWWAMLCAAGLYTQYFSAFILPAFWIYALVLDRRALRGTILGTACMALLYLPWAWPATRQMMRMLRAPDYWVTTRVDLLWFLRTVWETFVPSSTARLGLLAGVAGAVGLVLLAMRSRVRLSERVRRHALLLLAVVAPLALAFVAVTLAPKFSPRYAIVAAPPLYVGLALVTYSPVHRSGKWGSLIFIAVMSVAAALSASEAIRVAQGRSDARDDARGLAHYLNEQAQPNDAVLLVENAPYALSYYFRGAVPTYGLHVGQDFGGTAGKLNEILATHPLRVWLVLWHHEFADPTDMAVTELSRVGQEIALPKQFRGYQLRAFDIHDYVTVISAVPTPQATTDAAFGPFGLVGFDRWQRPGGELHYVLYWQLTKPVDRNYSMTWILRDIEGNEYLRRDQALSTPYFLPSVWPVGTPIRGRVDIALPADLPQQQYRAYLQVFDPASQSNLDILDADSLLRGQALLLESLQLNKSDLGPGVTPPANPLSVDWAGGLHLMGYRFPRSQYQQGDTARLTLWWHNDQPVSAQTPVLLRLVDAQGRPALKVQRPLLNGHQGDLPAGETNRAIYSILLPADLPAGQYYLEAGAGDTFTRLTSLQASERARQYAVPSMQHSMEARFGSSIALIGYDISARTVQPGAFLSTTLYWRCLEPMATSYKVSVQLVSADGRAVAQDDSVPSAWSRPTTGWLPDEIITDEHRLVLDAGLPTGDYAFVAIVYDEHSGERLTVDQGGKRVDHVLLAPVRVHR